MIATCERFSQILHKESFVVQPENAQYRCVPRIDIDLSGSPMR